MRKTVYYDVLWPSSGIPCMHQTVCSNSWLYIGYIFSIILFILYPTRLCRRCVSCCWFQRLHTLYLFVESYKVGTNGIWDIEWFLHHFSSSEYWARVQRTIAYHERWTADSNSQRQVYCMTQNIERRCACFQEKCYAYEVCIARAAVNDVS